MKAIEFPQQTLVVAKNQAQYQPLPAHVCYLEGYGLTMTFKYKMTLRERFRVLFSGIVWHSVLTFGEPLQPQLMNTKKPDFVSLPKK